MALIDTANLINIITETRVVPEFLFENCQAELIAAKVLEMLADPDAASVQRQICDRAIQMLGRGTKDGQLRAAKSVLKAIA